jgi:hypothetical protein
VEKLRVAQLQRMKRTKRSRWFRGDSSDLRVPDSGQIFFRPQ